MTDIALHQVGVGTFDLQLLDGVDLMSDEGLETAVILSLFTDKRLPMDQQSPDGTDDPRGWWGDIGDPDDVQLGSYLWLLWREKMVPATVSRAVGYTKDALKWMTDDGIARTVNATGERVGLDQCRVAGEIIRPTGEILRFAYLWDGEKAKFERKGL